MKHRKSLCSWRQLHNRENVQPLSATCCARFKHFNCMSGHTMKCDSAQTSQEEKNTSHACRFGLNWLQGSTWLEQARILCNANVTHMLNPHCLKRAPCQTDCCMVTALTNSTCIVKDMLRNSRRERCLHLQCEQNPTSRRGHAEKLMS
jgi:hypothetical protein